MDKKELRILQAAQGCEDTLKKRGIVAISMTALGAFSGMLKEVGIIGVLEFVVLFSLVLTPICAVPYRMVSIMTGRRVYLEDGDSPGNSLAAFWLDCSNSSVYRVYGSGKLFG